MVLCSQSWVCVIIGDEGSLVPPPLLNPHLWGPRDWVPVLFLSSPDCPGAPQSLGADDFTGKGQFLYIWSFLLLPSRAVRPSGWGCYWVVVSGEAQGQGPLEDHSPAPAPLLEFGTGRVGKRRWLDGAQAPEGQGQLRHSFELLSAGSQWQSLIWQ